MRLGYRESNPGLLREQSLLGSESQRCYRYTIPDGVECGSDQLLIADLEWRAIIPTVPAPDRTFDIKAIGAVVKGAGNICGGHRTVAV